MTRNLCDCAAEWVCVQLALHGAKAAEDSKVAAKVKSQLATAHYELATSRDELSAAKKRIRKLEAEVDRLKDALKLQIDDLQNQARSSASAGAAQYELEEKLTELRKQSSRDLEELAGARKEVATLEAAKISQKQQIEELQVQNKNSGSSDAQRLHALENELSDAKHQMSEAAKDFKFREDQAVDEEAAKELKTDEKIEQLKKRIHQLEEEKASNAALLEAGVILGREVTLHRH